MKRILLTSTSLVLAAGFASADVSFSGTAGIALIDDNGASVAKAAVVGAQGTGTTADTVGSAAVLASTRDGMFFESYYDLDITATAETDNGVSVKVGFDMGAGNKIDYDDDDKLEAQGGSIGHADVAVSYSGWTLAVDQDGIDNLFDDSQQEDAKLSGAVMGWTVALTTDQENSTSSYKLGGTVGGVSVTLTGTDNDDNGGDASKVAVSYAAGALTLSASVEDESKADGSEDDSTIGIKYAMNDALSLSYTSIKPGSRTGDDFGDEWDAKVAYSAGGMSASFAWDEADATTVIAEYTLGNGATAFAAIHDKAGTASDLTAIGLTFAF